MELEWDAAKAALNHKKHGIAFEDATLVFYDLGRSARKANANERKQYHEANS